MPHVILMFHSVGPAHIGMTINTSLSWHAIRYVWTGCSRFFNVSPTLWSKTIIKYTQKDIKESKYSFRSDQIRSVTQWCPTLCDPMNRSTPGLPVHHQLPEFTQTHVHRVGDAIQPSHPLSSPSPPAPNPSQDQSLFQWVNTWHEVAKVLEFQL